MNTQRIGLLLLISMLVLAGCGGANTANKQEQREERREEKVDVQTNENVNIKDDDEEKTNIVSRDDSGKVPMDLQEAENPTFPVGTKVKIYADHFEGLKGAEGTIVGAYHTTAYEVSFMPSTGGEKVNNYKWLISEELEGASGEPMDAGRELIADAEHIEGMKGATAVIESASEGPVYMVDIVTTTGEELKNYKWLTESELEAEE